MKMASFNPDSLQPSNLFKGMKAIPIPELDPMKETDTYWSFSFSGYKSILLKKVNEIPNIDKDSRSYLIGLINFMTESIKESELKILFKKIKINPADIIKNFGEVIGPFYAKSVLTLKARENADTIIFPERQNYEIYDFFLKDGKFYGFSSKGISKTSNPLVPNHFIFRLAKISKNDKGELGKIAFELEVLKSLATGGLFIGVVNTFNLLLLMKKSSSGFGSVNDIINIFKKTNLSADALRLSNNKEILLSKISGLSNQKAYETFLKNYIFPSISTDSKSTTAKNKKKDKNGEGYTATNLVYGMIKYIVSVQGLNLESVLRILFKDLYVIKMGLDGEGVPKWAIQTTIDAKKVFKTNNFKIGKDYAFRSKATWNKVAKYGLGIQL